MNDINFENIDNTKNTSEDYLKALLLQSKLVEWACVAYLKHNRDVSKACTWLLRTAYPVPSMFYDIDINTEQYLELKKYYKGNIPVKMGLYQNIYDAMYRQTDAKIKRGLFESKSSLELDRKVAFSVKNTAINLSGTYMATSLDKDLQLKNDKAVPVYISNVFEIMSYVYLIDKVLVDSMYVTGVPPVWGERSAPDVIPEDDDIYIDVDKSNLLKQIEYNIKERFINITASSFSRFIALKYMNNKNVGVPLYNLTNRRYCILFLCDLLIDFYKYNLIVDSCGNTFNNSAVDACKKEIDIISGVTSGTFEKDQQDLYSYTMSMFCPRPDSSGSLFNLIDAEVNVVKFTINNNKIQVDDSESYSKKNGISRLFCPRGSSNHYSLNIENIKKILNDTINIEPAHGKVDNDADSPSYGSIVDMLSTSKTVINIESFSDSEKNINLSEKMKLKLNNKEYPTSNLANSYILGGNFNDIVNSILLIGDSGFISTFGIVDFNKRGGDYGIKSFFDNSDKNFICNEFFVYPVWQSGFQTEYTLVQAFNIHDRKISVNELNYNSYKIKFDNKYSYTDNLVRCSVSQTSLDTVSSFIKTDKNLNEFYKSFLHKDNVSNQLTSIFYSSPGEHSFLINEYYYVYDKNKKVNFKKLSSSFCPSINTVLNGIMGSMNKHLYHKMKLLYITKIPIFNVFRVNLLIKYLSQSEKYIYNHIEKDLLDEDLKKYYNEEVVVSMKKFELNK